MEEALAALARVGPRFRCEPTARPTTDSRSCSRTIRATGRAESARASPMRHSGSAKPLSRGRSDLDSGWYRRHLAQLARADGIAFSRGVSPDMAHEQGPS